MKKFVVSSVVMIVSMATSLHASDKTIWGEQIVANSAQSPANKGEGSATPLASRRPATINKRGLATKKPSRVGRYAARRGETKPVKQTIVKNKKSKPAKTPKKDTHAEAVITTQEQLDAVVAENKPVFVKVSIEGCPPCLAMKPVFADLATSMGQEVTFINVDSTKKNFLKVKAYPTFIGYKHGKEEFRLVGENSAKQLQSEITSKLLP